MADIECNMYNAVYMDESFTNYLWQFVNVSVGVGTGVGTGVGVNVIVNLNLFASIKQMDMTNKLT